MEHFDLVEVVQPISAVFHSCNITIKRPSRNISYVRKARTIVEMTHRAALLRSALCLTTAKPRPSPTLFCFPGLESVPWHDTSKFEWVKHLEANRETIASEYLALKRQREALAKTEQTASDYKVYDKEHQLHQGQWDWLSYVTQGRRQADFAVQCPKTVEILESIPGFMAGLPFTYSFFSVLKPEVRGVITV